MVLLKFARGAAIACLLLLSGCASQGALPSSFPQDASVELVVYPGRKSIYELVANPFGRSEGVVAAVGAMLGFKDPRGLQMLTAPLQIFRRGEPLALMPNIFVK